MNGYSLLKIPRGNVVWSPAFRHGLSKLQMVAAVVVRTLDACGRGRRAGMLSSLRAGYKARVVRCGDDFLCRGFVRRSLDESRQGDVECGDAYQRFFKLSRKEAGQQRKHFAGGSAVFGRRRAIVDSDIQQSQKRESSNGSDNARSLIEGVEQLLRSPAVLKDSGGGRKFLRIGPGISLFHRKFYSSGASFDQSKKSPEPQSHGHSERAVVTALWCNFLVLALKCGVWYETTSHVMLAEAVHSLADLANQGLLAYGLVSSRRAPDALHPYGYSKERFVWSLISAVGIFCLGSGATIVHGISNLWHAEPLDNMFSAAIVIGGSMCMEGASLYVAVNAVRQGAAAEGMRWQDYIWRGHDPTSVAVMMEDGAAVTGLGIAAISLTAVNITGNPIWDPIGSIIVGNLLGMVAVFLIQRNRHALLGRSMDPKDVKRVLDLLSADPVVDAIYDCKSEVIGPGSYRFKAEIDFDGVVVVHNYLQRIGREAWIGEFQEAAKDPRALEIALANYGEEVVAALGSEVDRLEKEIQKIVPGVRHVDIEAHNPKGPVP